jgi:hypothetical protein
MLKVPQKDLSERNWRASITGGGGEKQWGVGKGTFGL